MTEPTKMDLQADPYTEPLPEPSERGSTMTPAERLQWLERAKRDFGKLLGSARGTTKRPPARSTP